MSETEWVRIRLDNGAEVSVNAGYAASVNAEVLDVPATNLRGAPLSATRKNGRPPKAKTTVNTEAAKKAAPQVASPTTDAGSSVAGSTPEEAS